MTLNEDDVYAINQALRHCYKQDAYIYANGTTEQVKWNELWDKFSGAEVLKDQEDAIKWRTLGLTMEPSEIRSLVIKGKFSGRVN